MALFGRSNLLFYRLTFPTTRHYSIVRAPRLACGEKCLDSYYYAAVDRTKIANAVVYGCVDGGTMPLRRI